MSGEQMLDMLWMGALAVIPVTVLVALLCRWGGCRPATRHTLWIICLLSLASPVIGRLVPTQAWVLAVRDAWITHDPVDDTQIDQPRTTGAENSELTMQDVEPREAVGDVRSARDGAAAQSNLDPDPDPDPDPDRDRDRDRDPIERRVAHQPGVGPSGDSVDRDRSVSSPAPTRTQTETHTPTRRGAEPARAGTRQPVSAGASGPTGRRSFPNSSPTSSPTWSPARDEPAQMRGGSGRRAFDSSPAEPRRSSPSRSGSGFGSSPAMTRSTQTPDTPPVTRGSEPRPLRSERSSRPLESGAVRDAGRDLPFGVPAVTSPPPSGPATGGPRPPASQANPADDQASSSDAVNAMEPVESASSVEPVETQVATDAASRRSRFSMEWGMWISGWLQVRDALRAVPSPPSGLWIGGVALVLCVFTLRLLLHARWARKARVAPREVQALADEVSSMLGLRRVPGVYMIDARVSPMISCGLKPRVLLPTTLWSELDDMSRRAVMLHELAHLRRRDHRVCWIESVLGVLYWWHPLVWWVRRRIREEADLCCDAWVTSLMPRNRRAYAQALVTTRTFLNSPPPAPRTPACGLSMASARSRRFTRRLTMVMTERVGPSLSIFGGALAGVVAVTGLIILPGLTCPPDKDDKPEAPTGIVAELAAPVVVSAPTTSAAVVIAPGVAGVAVECPPEPEAPRASRATRATRASRAVAGVRGGGTASGPEAEEQTTFERYMDGRGGDQPDTNELREILRELDRRLQRLEEREDKCAPNRSGLMGGGGGRGHASGGPSSPFGGVAVSGGRGGPRAGSAPSGGGGPGLFGGGSSVAAPNNNLRFGGGNVVARENELFFGDADDDAVIIRHYYLPDGKLDELTELMLRNDVPIPVAPGNGYIEVHATARQHRVFEAFARMIHPDGVRITGDDLPPVGFNIQVEEPWELAPWNAEQAELAAAAEVHRAEAATRVAQMRDLQVRMRQIDRERERIHRMAERAHDRAERLEHRAETVRERAECNELDDASAESLLEEAEAILVQAAHVIEEAEELEARAADLEDEAEAVEYEIEDLECEAEAHEDEAEELMEEIEEILEEMVDRN